MISFLSFVAAILLAADPSQAADARTEEEPGGAFCCASSRGGNTFFEDLAAAPFPCGADCDTPERPFLDGLDTASGVRVHTSTGGVGYPERGHYDSPLTVIHVPPGFDRGKPFTWVVWLHGPATRVLVGARRLRLMDQIDQSQENVILVAPQLARDAIDGAPGKFGLEGGFGRFIEEVSRVTRRKKGWGDDPRFDAAPVVLAAHGTGSLAVARILERGGVAERIRGVILLDPSFADDPSIASWAARGRGTLIGLYTASTEEAVARLRERLVAAGATLREDLPPSWDRGGLLLMRSGAAPDQLPLEGPPEAPLLRFLAGVNGARGPLP